MAVLWRTDSATVEQVRSALPSRYRSAYTTVQTVLNRLAERGLLSRKRVGQAIVYTTSITETEYVSREVRRTLNSASAAARHAALAQLVGDFEDDADELATLAREAQSKRSGKSK